ncbi:hypothetical protein PENANT_c001G06111 [Penicillium antarcticum]|uniref:CENP-V/GFA domain-containing protein n=1 Tax=Penicillium antarcticum TaxID=416450 RepID=A0A1V6QMF1_9EURO|nr:uncharacterized protein N7508_010181 [Penicillium antarcticum]KAJ5295360.1 hypothetical protein N7508_010181 [Penicillium antarcticum]OQD90410.1 hypothetical protein PENANT_c001G06111 [Penicillium antarcticum]
MAVGGCSCGKIRITYSGQPIATGLCHCLDCRKLTGGPFSYNFIIKAADLKVTGSPKELAKTSDSGNDIKNYFCPDCGTPLFGRKTNGGQADDVTVLRAGIFDDIGILDERKPDVEIYTISRLKWLAPVEGAHQFSGMFSL